MAGETNQAIDAMTEPVKIVIMQGDKTLSVFTCVDYVSEAFLKGEDIHAWVGGYDPEINACRRGRIFIDENEGGGWTWELLLQ